MEVIREEIAATPKALTLPEGCDLDEAQFLQLVKDFTLNAHATIPQHIRDDPRTLRPLDFTATPSDQLSDEKQREQDLLIKQAEELCVNLGMPSDDDPKTSRRHINEVLRANGELPFPFDQLTEINVPSTPTGKAVQLDMQGQNYMAGLGQRSPQMYERLNLMLQVYIDKSSAAGHDFMSEL